MNEVIRQLFARKSVRVFTDQPIEESIVQTILKAATMAPTAGNQQLYTIIRVNDPTLLDRLADSCDHQSFIAKGELVLVFCADCLKWYDAFAHVGCSPRLPGPGDLLLAVDDALIAAQNAVFAAELNAVPVDVIYSPITTWGSKSGTVWQNMPQPRVRPSGRCKDMLPSPSTGFHSCTNASSAHPYRTGRCAPPVAVFP